MKFAAALGVTPGAHAQPLDERFHHGWLAALDGGKQRP
jgi:hypothetical protein